MKVKDGIQQQITTLNRQLGNQHDLYAITLTAKESFVREQGMWHLEEAKNSLIAELVHQMHHRLSGHAQNKYQRDCYKNKRMFLLGIIEHRAKGVSVNDSTQQVEHAKVPVHLHGIVGIHSDYENKILECFDEKQQPGLNSVYHLKKDLFKGNAWHQFEQAVESVQLERIWDLDGYADYIIKKVDTNVHQNNEYGAMSIGMAA
ncbi:hypothetical protein N8254_05680 [Pseudomonadales bacterium]|nr:hypothetical protein [Pseudomonadales bacterium]